MLLDGHEASSRRLTPPRDSAAAREMLRALSSGPRSAPSTLLPRDEPAPSAVDKNQRVPAAGESRRISGVEPRHASWHVLADPNFRLYFAGSTLSNLGTWLQNTAQALLAYHLGHSVLAVGVVVCAQFSPVTILGPWAGSVAARVRSRKHLLVVTQAVSAVVAITLTTLYFAHLLNEVTLAAGAFALGLAYCFALPAFSVLVPALVPEHETRAAMAMNSVSYNVGRTVAPLFAVLIVTTIGYGWVFILNAASFTVLVLVLAKLKPQRALGRSSHGKLLDGFRLAKQERGIWVLLAMVAAVTIAADPVLVLGPAMARHFGVSPNWAGYFLAFLGAGTVSGSLIPLSQPKRLRNAATPVFLLGAAIIVFALGINFYLCLIMAVVAGIACLLAGSITQALLLNLARPERAATVMAVWAIAWAGTKPLASLIDGALASHLGLQWAGILLALPALVPGAIIVCFPERMWLKGQVKVPVVSETRVPVAAS
jgi:MFS family permease